MEVLPMMTSGELCKKLNIRYCRLDYLIRSGYIEEPKRLASGQRVFTDEEVKKIKEIIFERVMTK